jgi:hypothetical protein
MGAHSRTHTHSSISWVAYRHILADNMQSKGVLIVMVLVILTMDGGSGYKYHRPIYDGLAAGELPSMFKDNRENRYVQ